MASTTADEEIEAVPAEGEGEAKSGGGKKKLIMIVGGAVG
jgi:hypothetical protein